MIDDVTDLATIQELSAAGRHQECLQACQNALQTNPEETYPYKYAGKSLLALGQFQKAQQCLVRAHLLALTWVAPLVGPNAVHYFLVAQTESCSGS